MRRQLLATAAAITTILAVAFAAPAFADHETPTEVEGNPSCESLGLGESLEKIEFAAGDQPTEFAVDPADYPGFVITAVIVKGGPSAFVYVLPPFDHLTAPDGKEISHIEVCGEEEEETPSPTPTPTETPTKTPTETPTVLPTTPAPVPTEVPAGTNTGGSDSLGLWGLIAGTCAAVAGAAVVVRRRFLHDS
jgi:hypothetical protein